MQSDCPAPTFAVEPVHGAEHEMARDEDLTKESEGKRLGDEAIELSSGKSFNTCAAGSVLIFGDNARVRKMHHGRMQGWISRKPIQLDRAPSPASGFRKARGGAV